MTAESDYSRQALLDFLELLTTRGLANKNTALGMKAACGKILQGLSPHEENDVREVDVDTAVRRFANKPNRSETGLSSRVRSANNPSDQ